MATGGDLRNFVGQLNHAAAYSFPSGMTWVATTDGGASPPIGERWIRMADTLNSTVQLPPHDPLATTFDFYDIGLGYLRLEGNISDRTVWIPLVEVENDANQLQLALVGQVSGGSTFKTEIHIGNVQQAAGSTVFDQNTNILPMFVYDNSVDDWILYVNGAEEARWQPASGRAPDFTGLRAGKTQSATPTGLEVYLAGGPWLSTRSSGTDQPNPDAEILVRDLDGDGNYDQFGDEANCANDGAATWTDWNDYNSDGTPGTSDPANYVCHDLDGATHRMTSTLANTPDHDASRVIVGCGVNDWSRNTEAGKDVDHYVLIRESSTDIEKQTPGITTTSYSARRQVFPDTPSGGAWSNTILDAMECGVRVTENADGNIIIIALGFESVALREFEPAAAPTGDRRRTLAGFV